MHSMSHVRPKKLSQTVASPVQGSPAGSKQGLKQFILFVSCIVTDKMTRGLGSAAKVAYLMVPEEIMVTWCHAITLRIAGVSIASQRLHISLILQCYISSSAFCVYICTYIYIRVSMCVYVHVCMHTATPSCVIIYDLCILWKTQLNVLIQTLPLTLPLSQACSRLNLGLTSPHKQVFLTTKKHSA